MPLCVSCGFKRNAGPFSPWWEERLELFFIEAIHRLGFPNSHLIVNFLLCVLEKVPVDGHNAKWASIPVAEYNVITPNTVRVASLTVEARHNPLRVHIDVLCKHIVCVQPAEHGFLSTP